MNLNSVASPPLGSAAAAALGSQPQNFAPSSPSRPISQEKSETLPETDPSNETPGTSSSNAVTTSTTQDSAPLSNGKRKTRSTIDSGSSSKRQRPAGAYMGKANGDSSSKNKDYSPPSARLSDLGGVQVCVEKILELVAMPISHPEVYIHTGVQPPRGVLLHGPPGCGKTLLAHAIAGVCVYFYIIIRAYCACSTC